MSKSLKIFLIVLLVLAVGVFVGWREGWFASFRLFSSGISKPGTCLLVEEKYCSEARFIYFEEARDPILGFKILAGAPVFAPTDGSTAPISMDNPSSPNSPYSGILLRHFVIPNSTAGLISVNVLANPLSDMNQNSEAQKGDVLGYVSENTVDAFGDYNLIVSIENQALFPGTVYSNTNLYIEDKLGI
ncbi:MAG TPA: hypothetical protein PLH22_02615 [Candidatus Colwellbacteria bacterium]|nr:hypothetical protein [Candidatus Colwellbacteria bacterium]